MYYTKYRPQKFSEMMGKGEAAEALSRQVSTGKTVHAYLFVGPRGTGKTTTARILAKAINCLNLEKNGDPCGKCEMCDAIQKGSLVDLIEIDAASNRGIDDIRELKSKVKLAPAISKYKVYIIDEVHMLTPEAFNALLKTLEEPPAHVVFILCTTELHKVPETIKSRCQVFKIKRATIPQIIEKLKNIAKSEKIKIKDEELEKIAEASVGGFRDAETLLQQVVEGGLSIESLMGSSSKDKILEFTDYLMNKDSQRALRLINKVYEDGVDIYIWTGEVLRHFRELILLREGVESDIGITGETLEEMKKQIKSLDPVWTFRVISLLLESHKNIKGSFIPQLPLEIAVVRICNLGNDKYDESTEGVPEDKSSEKGAKATTVILSEVDKKLLEVITKDPDEDEPSTSKESKDTPAKKKNKKDDVAEESNSVSKTISKEADAADSTESSDILDVNIETIVEKWKEVITKSKDFNHSISALLKSGKPKEIKGRFLILEVFFPFHKERLESPKNRTLVENLLEDMFGVDLRIKCALSEEKPKSLKKGESGNLTDFNIAPADFDKNTLLQVFDGGLPL